MGGDKRSARDAVTGARAADVGVALVLIAWWIISPASYDDGWTIARQTTFASAGGFSQYFEAFGVNLPLGYWLEWAQHWLTERTNALVFLRVPALICLGVTWVVCRWILVQLVDQRRVGRSVALWGLAVSFAAMAMAWGMTFRQEPTVALLVAGVLACCIRLVRDPGVRPLAIAAVLIPLALTAHPTGVVALAPLIVVLPTAFRWARGEPAAAVALFTASGALLLVLAFVGSDVEQRARDAQTISSVSATVVKWQQELVRYEPLSEDDFAGVGGWGTPLRRAAVALMFLAVLAYFGRARGGARTVLDLPAPTLALALLLLVSTPSKWPWHFGALIGLGAVAVAAETARLRRDLADARGWKSARLSVSAFSCWR